MDYVLFMRACLYASACCFRFVCEEQHSIHFALSLPQDFEGKAKVKEWIGTLEGMTADETLSETQVRQMIFDLESAYNAFNRLLQHT